MTCKHVVNGNYSLDYNYTLEGVRYMFNFIYNEICNLVNYDCVLEGAGYLFDCMYYVYDCLLPLLPFVEGCW